MSKEKLVIMFSGGRTSGFMSKWIKDNKSDEYDLFFVYCNTGQEHKNTLLFVDQCDKAFGLNLHWIEADVQKKGVGTNYKTVDYETASLNGKPFEDVVKKYGLPNSDFPHCTRELKIEPFKKWAKDIVSEDGDYKIAMGIRADEKRRIRNNPSYYYPLNLELPTTKEDILSWWKKQSFDLKLPEHLGNCTWCWKKSDKKLATLAKDYPEIFEFPSMLEEKYSFTSNYDRKDERKMFRKYKTVHDVFELSKQIDFEEFSDPNFSIDDCAEECGSVWNE